MSAAVTGADVGPVRGQVPAIALERVSKVYRGGVRALQDVSLAVEPGTFLAIMGPSGSGKSTLMHCAAGLDSPTSGSIRIDGQEIGGLGETRRTELRRERIGFVFQAYNLVPSLSIEDNITLPLRLAGKSPDRDWLRSLVERVGLGGRLTHRPAELSGGQQQRAAIVRALVARPAVVFADEPTGALVERVGLTGRLTHRPAELSGGQQQRAAIARALVSRPAVVFADEPTGALDLRSAHEVLALLRDLVDELRQTVVMVTHDPAAAAQAHQALVMADGRVVDTLDAPTATALADRLVMLGRG